MEIWVVHRVGAFIGYLCEKRCLADRTETVSLARKVSYW